MSNRFHLAIAAFCLGWTLACGGALPEVTPGLFDQPKSVQTHGRMVEKSYRKSNGPRTISYKIIEVEGRPGPLRGFRLDRRSGKFEFPWRERAKRRLEHRTVAHD